MRAWVEDERREVAGLRGATCRRGCAGGRRGSSTGHRPGRGRTPARGPPRGRAASASRGSTIVAPSRAHASRRSPSRPACGSAATIRPRLAMSAARCVVFVPGAAHTSATVSPGRGPSACPTRMAASSWTATLPSRRGGELPEVARALEREALGREPRRRRADARLREGPRPPRRPSAGACWPGPRPRGASFMASASASVSVGPVARPPALDEPRRAATRGARAPPRGPRPSGRARDAARSRSRGARRSRRRSPPRIAAAWRAPRPRGPRPTAGSGRGTRAGRP